LATTARRCGPSGSQTSNKWPGAREGAKQWRSFDRYPDGPKAGTIFHYAREADRNWDRDYWRELERKLAEAYANNEWEDDTEGTTDQGAGPEANSQESKSDDAGPKAEQAKAETPKSGLFFSSADFVHGFTPPDYILDGIVQRKFLYALTARSNEGKTAILHRIAAHAATGTALAGSLIEKTKVLYLAGENPDDHRMRWILLCDEMKIDPATLGVHWLPFCVDLSATKIKKQIHEQDAEHGPFGLIVADTSQAYFRGDNENDNPQMLDHAKMFRGLIDLLPGGPAIMVSCHPTKNGDRLIPRGGSAFFNEIDTNLCIEKRVGTTVADLHWVEKIRGVDFAPLPFELRKGQCEKLKDAKGRKIWSVAAIPITEAAATGLQETNEAKAMEALVLIAEAPSISLADLAARLGWYYASGEPNKSLAQRILNSLVERKLLDKGPPRSLTRKGCRVRGEWVENHGPDAPM
jgi:hypothetical protein